MHRVEGGGGGEYVLLNISGISSLICSRVGQIGIERRENYKKFVLVIICLQTTVAPMCQFFFSHYELIHESF